ncbi:hypothetical protein SEMRO_1463_G274870.1 [Seminavis robusta]|uniref:Uncharacterized protein n=1 Tax=Seminavis robusta TaxID=568900 RepID=A0A9N8HQN4_9STRA|nr:hypothetical protein SEMRO_1463_G274870.1 [Seminavis robusta]|eukprot:Sro1463_g274870.1 n/a (192) ;mRNA; f:27010-27585
MTQLGADKVPILGIQCHIEDEPIFDKWALSGKHHPKYDVFHRKIQKSGRSQDLRKALAQHMAAVDAITGIPVDNISPAHSKAVFESMQQLTNDKGHKIFTDLEPHKTAAVTGKHYVLCHKDDRDLAVQELQKLFDVMPTAQHFQGKKPSIPERQPRPPKDTRFDDYSVALSLTPGLSKIEEMRETPWGASL